MKNGSKFMAATLLLVGLQVFASVPAASKVDLKKIPTAQLIQDIKNEYKIKSPADCVTGISKQALPEERFEDAYQQACVVAGYKNVYMRDTTADLFEKDLDAPQNMNPKVRELITRSDSPVGYFFAKTSDNISMLYMYTKGRGELNTYRLALALLQKHCHEYLSGLLLGYSAESIKFFYQVNEFLSKRAPQPTINNYDQWPEKLKQQFQGYKSKQAHVLSKYKSEAESFLSTRKKKISDYKTNTDVLEIMQANNPYLGGWLMRKSDAEIEFMILGTNFLYDVAKIQYWTTGNYAQWPDSMKRAFEEYEKSVGAYTDLAKDSQKAKKWLKDNGKKTVDQLKSEIKSLEAQLEKKDKPEPQQKPVDQTQTVTGVNPSVAILDYNVERDYPEVMKIYDQFDEKTLKSLHIHNRTDLMNKIDRFFKISPKNMEMYNLAGTSIHNKVLRSADGKFIGVVVCQTDRNKATGAINNCDIAEVFVSNQFQGKGFGRQLMQIGIDFFVKNGCKDITLQVHPDNTGAIKLYKRLGFEEVQKTEDNIYMQKIVK